MHTFVPEPECRGARIRLWKVIFFVVARLKLSPNNGMENPAVKGNNYLGNGHETAIAPSLGLSCQIKIDSVRACWCPAIPPFTQEGRSYRRGNMWMVVRTCVTLVLGDAHHMTTNVLHHHDGG